MYEDIAGNLNKTVDVIERTFESVNLQVMNIGFCGIQENGWLQILIEVSSIEGSKIERNVAVKINFYNNDAILFENNIILDADSFRGYDTLHMYINENDLAYKTTKTRLYATVV